MNIVEVSTARFKYIEICGYVCNQKFRITNVEYIHIIEREREKESFDLLMRAEK